MPVQIVGRVHGRQEWERPFLGVAVGLVIDVVEDQAIHAEGIQALEGDISDLLGLLRVVDNRGGVSAKSRNSPRRERMRR